MVLLTATGYEFFVANMTIFPSYTYDALEDNLTHMNSIKLKSYPGENITDCFSEILLDAERL